MNLDYKSRYIIAQHTIVGIIIFYFFIHPLTMVIYWYEYRGLEFVPAQFFSIVIDRLKDSFSFQMMGMSLTFIILGGLVGLFSGIYYKKILQKNEVLKRQEKQLERNIELIIDNGENEKVEFKSSLRHDYVKGEMNKDLEKVFLKTIAGFLNAKGGTLLIGVDDDGRILGLKIDYSTLKKKNRDGFELKLMQLISTQIGTEFCAMAHISFHQLKEKDVCQIEVTPTATPAFVTVNGKPVFYLRTGNSTRALTVQEAVNYINFRKNTGHDSK